MTSQVVPTNTIISEWEDDFGLEEIMIIFDEHTSFYTLIRDPRLFDAAIFGQWDWIKALWAHRANGQRLSEGMPARREYGIDVDSGESYVESETDASSESETTDIPSDETDDEGDGDEENEDTDAVEMDNINV